MTGRTKSVLLDAAKGALAGAAGLWLMGKVTTEMYKREDKAAKRREEDVRGGRTAFASAADKLAEIVGTSLSPERSEKLGSALHWAVGTISGAAYAVAKPRVSCAGWGNGLLFGAAVWGILDEWANVAFGFTPGPTQFPWQAHARGLAGHAVYGVVTDSALRVADRIYGKAA